MAERFVIIYYVQVGAAPVNKKLMKKITSSLFLYYKETMTFLSYSLYFRT